MKRVVVSLLQGATAMSVFGLAACGGSVVELEVGQAYCIVADKKPDGKKCTRLETLYIVTHEDTLIRFWPEEPANFYEHSKIAGNTITRQGDSFTLKPKRGHFRVIPEDSDSDQKAWFVKADTAVGRKLSGLYQSIAKLNEGTSLPENQPAYVNVPFCYEEQLYRNGQLVDQMSECRRTAAFFADNGDIIQMGLSNIQSGGQVGWGTSGTWSMHNWVGRPDEYQDYEWSISSEGNLVTKRKVQRPERTGFQQRYDPTVRETQLTYRLYTGAERDALLKAYQEQVYPAAMERRLIEDAFPQ